MKNLILSITRDTIPYVKEIRPLAGSVAACIVMQQLDFWFARHPDGFYKFLEPCGTEGYKSGDSWTEELGMSADEFRTAFDKIGTRYVSKTTYEAAPDKFQDKYYCSYFDKKQGKTWYFRNHELTDAALTAIIQGKRHEPVTVDGKRQLQETEVSSSINGAHHLGKSDKARSSTKETKNTTQSTQTQQQNDDVVDLSTSLSVLSSEQQDEFILRLQQLRVSPTRAAQLVKQYPERVPSAVAGWERNLEYLNTRDNPGGAVAASIESPDKYPQIYAIAAPQSSRNGHKPQLTIQERRERFSAAYEAVWLNLSPSLRATYEKEGKSREEAIEAAHDNELQLAMRQQKAPATKE